MNESSISYIEIHAGLTYLPIVHLSYAQSGTSFTFLQVPSLGLKTARTPLIR